MPTFFINRQNISGDTAVLSGTEAGHMLRSLRLGPEELSPRRARSSRRRAEPLGPEHSPDGGCAHPDAHLAQLALDANVAPAGVLPGQAQDDFTDLGVDWRTAELLSPSVGPLPPHKLSVPAKERLRRDHERGPAVAGQEPTGRREECSVGRAKVRTPDLPAQDAQLVTQDRDLDLLGGDGRTSATASTDQPAEHEIEDGPDHGR